MPATGQRADAVQMVHTGAVSHAVAQADPDASLGAYRSSTRAGGLGFILSSPIANLRLDYVSGANGSGVGAITVADANSVRWTAPGGTDGPAVAIASGETKLLEDGADPGKFVIVRRTTSAALGGAATAQITGVVNDAIGQLNGTVSGSITYRAIAFRAGDAVIQNLKIWIAVNDHPIRIALETPASQPAGNVQAIANETTAPTGRTFVSPTSAAHVDVLSVAALAPGAWICVWVERNLAAVVGATPRAETALGWSYTAIG